MVADANVSKPCSAHFGLIKIACKFSTLLISLVESCMRPLIHLRSLYSQLKVSTLPDFKTLDRRASFYSSSKRPLPSSSGIAGPFVSSSISASPVDGFLDLKNELNCFYLAPDFLPEAAALAALSFFSSSLCSATQGMMMSKMFWCGSN